MKKIIVLGLCLCANVAAAADDTRWITFKNGRNSQGPVLHQIDRDTIHMEGPYRSFWTRVWLVNDRQPLAFTRDEQIEFLSQKFVVDCAQHRFGDQFVDSNFPSERSRKISLAKMRWKAIEKFPAVNQAVCGGK